MMNLEFVIPGSSVHSKDSASGRIFRAGSPFEAHGGSF